MSSKKTKKELREPDTEYALDKHFKELRCLYDIASITGAPDISLRNRFIKIVNILTGAFHYPDIAFARITLNGDEFKTANFRDTPHKLSSDIVVGGIRAGTVEIGYTQTPPKSENGLFTKEEGLMLDAVAERLGAITEHRQAEEALKESEKKFSMAFNASANLVAINRLEDGVFLEVNDSFTRITGYTREEAIGRNASGLNMWVDEAEHVKLVKALNEAKKVRNEEIRIRHKSGEIISGLYSSEPITVSGEQCYLHTITDISNLKQAEEALRESEEKFSKAFRASPDIITITTLKDGKFIEVNDSFTRYSGYSREEVIGRPVIDVGGWAGPEERASMIRTLEKEGRVRNIEVMSNTKTGEAHVGLFSADLIDIGGEPCVIAVVTDITEQKQSQEILQTVSHNSPLGIYIMQDEKLQYTNPQFQKITGYSQKELLDRELLSLVAIEDSDVVRSSTAFTLQEKNPYPCEYRIINKNGQVKWVMQTVSPIRYEGREAILGNLMDITERKYLERKVIEYEELSKLKSDLLATVSHELRTPLATIKGYSTMILDYYSRLSSNERKDYLKAIDNSTNRLTKLVDNLLDTSRMEAGLLKLEKSPTSIQQLIQKAVAEASIRANHHKIVIETDNRLPRVSIDVKRIRQVLDNLIDNAIKYSPPGTEVLISARKSGSELLITIKDQGEGIPAGELTSIFDRMYRIEQRLSSGVDGMGLGLYICQGLVEAHGGRIWAESTVGQGSTIQFTLPIINAGKRKIKR
jgi:PAS domain S-box-containing protein